MASRPTFNRPFFDPKAPPVLIIAFNYKPYLEDLSDAIKPAFRVEQFCTSVKNAVLYLRSIYPPLPPPPSSSPPTHPTTTTTTTTNAAVAPFDAKEPRIIVVDHSFDSEDAWETIRAAVPREYWCDGRGFVWLRPKEVESGGVGIEQAEEVERIRVCFEANRSVLERISRGEIVLKDDGLRGDFESGVRTREGLQFWY